MAFNFFGDPGRMQTVDTATQQRYGQNLLDPTSQYNKGQYNRLKQMGIDSAAQENLSGMRMAAQGNNPFANEQYKAKISSVNQQAQDAYNQYLIGAYSQGSGLLGQALQGNQFNAEQQNMRKMQLANNQSSFWQGLAGNAVGALPSIMFPGRGGS